MLLRLGSSGAAVAEVRARLAHLGLLSNTDHSDVFDDDCDVAVRTFQQERGLTADGIVGPDTFRRLDEARWQLGDRVLQFVPGTLMRGDDVAELQRRLNQLGFDSGRADGMFGRNTDSALREFQRGCGVNPDGICGPDTFRAFERLVRAVSGGNSATLREHVSLSDLRSGIADKVIVIDPGAEPSGALCHAVAVRVEGRLAALGTQVLLTHGTVASALKNEHDRADFANRVQADLVIAIHVDSAPSDRPNGLATFYFGDPDGGVHSTGGRALAERLQDELTAQTTLLDCRSHPRTWDLLRMTRMPAVRIDLGYATNPGDAARHADATFIDAASEGIARALTAFCSPG